MKPVRWRPDLMTFSHPDAAIGDLPVLMAGGVKVSAWKPTLKDRLRILFGGLIFTGLHSEGQPPMWVTTDTPVTLKDVKK